MKKIMITLAMIITLTTGAFANEEKVNPEVLNAFNRKFTRAADVAWTISENYYKASFTYHGYLLFAWYNTKAELLGVTRNISSSQLPLYLQSILEKKYADYWITGLVEESNRKGFSYYITLEDANQKIVLRSGSGSDWQIHHKYNKF